MFKRKVYNELLEWKEKYADRSACLLEGARRVGKSTIALEFVKRCQPMRAEFTIAREAR